MFKRIIFIVYASLLLSYSLPMASAQKPPHWQIYSFNGKEFREDKLSGRTSVGLLDGYLPIVVANESALREDRLPRGAGGLAILCYIQSSGGKLQSHSGYIPMGGVAVEVSGKEIKLAGRADADGYLILALPPGEYEVRVASFTNKVRVEKGKNSIIAVRGGKRMVD